MRRSSCTKWYKQKENVIAVVLATIFCLLAITAIITFRSLEDKRIAEEKEKIERVEE